MCRLQAIAIGICCLVSVSLGQPQSRASVISESGTAVLSSKVALDAPALPAAELKGDLLMARGNYAAALDAYQGVAQPTAVTWNKVGVAYHHLFALDEALKNYKLAIALDPHYAGAYNNLGAVYHAKHEFGQAEKAYKRALKYQPRSAVTYCNLGTAYFAQSKYKKGVEAYRRAMAIDPEVFKPDRREQVEEGSSREQRMSVAFFLAEAYASAGKSNEALDSLRKAFSYGFNDRKRLMEDKELGSLRSTPEFRQLLADQRLE